MVLVKKGQFFRLFFLGNIGHENVFYHILEPKNLFSDYENNKFKKLKNCGFSKGLSMCFYLKRVHFSVFSF